MKTYKKTKWNSFRLLALGSILACANGYQAIAATDPVITWPTLSPITYGTPLSSANVLSATANVSGTFVYRVSAINQVLTDGYKLLPAHTNWTVAAEFTPSDLSNYNAKTETRSLTVSAMQLQLVINSPSKSFGEPNPVFDFTWVGSTPLAEDQVTGYASCSATESSSVGAYTIAGGITDPIGRATNYVVNVTPGTLTISKTFLYLTPTTLTTNYGKSIEYVRTDADSFTATLPNTVTYRADLTNINATVRLYSTSDKSNPYTGNNRVTSHWPQANDDSTPSYYYMIDSATAKNPTAGAAGGQAFEASGNYTVVSNVNSVLILPVALTLSATNQSWAYGNWQQATGTISGVVTTTEFDDMTNLVFTWTSASYNAVPGTYAITPGVNEKTTAPGRLKRNYRPIELNSGVLTITKRVPTITWNLPTSSITYGTVIGSTYTAATSSSGLDTAVFPELPPTLSYSIPAQPMNVGNNSLVVNSPETAVYSAVSVTKTLTVNPFLPTINWAGVDSTNYLARIAFGTPITSVQRAATAVGSSTPGATAPGDIQYDVLEGTILEANAAPYSTPHTITASTDPNQNYLGASRTVSIIVTNGVFDIADAVVGTLRATVGNAPVTFAFSGTAKVGDPSVAAASKLTIIGDKYFTDSGLTTTSTVTAELVNTNADASSTGDVHFAFTPTIASLTDGSFSFSGTISPTDIYPRTTNNQQLVLGTNFELRVGFPDSYYSNGIVSVKGATNKYVVTVGKLSTKVTVNTDNSNISYVYGSRTNITFPVKVSFTDGDIDITGTNVIVNFNGQNYNVPLTNKSGSDYTGTFDLDITSTAANYTPYNSASLTATATLPTDGLTFNGSEKSITVGFTKRDVTFYATTNIVPVIYGEWASTSPYCYTNLAYAIPQLPTATSGLTSWDSNKVFAANILPASATTWSATPVGGTPYTLSVGGLDWSKAPDTKAFLNYNVIKQNGSVFVMRRQLNLVVESASYATNENHTNTIGNLWHIDNWVESTPVKDSLGITGNGKLELYSARLTNAPVSSTYYITNRWGSNDGTLPATPDTAHYANAKILTNYVEYPFASDGTYDNSAFGSQQYSFYIKGAVGTNYYVKTTVPYGILTVVGIKPTYTWNPAAMTYGDAFGANNVMNALVYTNGVLDTNLAHYTYFATRNDGTPGEVQIFASSGAFRIPMATNALPVRMHYDSGLTSFAQLDVTSTVNVNKAGLYLIIDNVSQAYNASVAAGFGLHITYNGIRNGDSIYGGVRPIFARNPDTNAFAITNFLSTIPATNVGTYITPLGNYSITPRIDDNGFNSPSNYNVIQYVQGTYTILGAAVAGSTPAGWDGTTNSSNFQTTYGWYYKKSDLYSFFTGATSLTPAPSNPDQVVIKVNGSSIDDGTLLNAQTNVVVFTYTPSATYQSRSFTNLIRISKYTIHANLKWDSAVGSQTARAYRDKVNLFPVLWNKSTNFALLTNMTSGGPFTNFVTFEYNEARPFITNQAGSVVKLLTNTSGLTTNLMFAVTNELMSDLGLELYDVSTETSVSPAAYNVGLRATSASGLANYDIVLQNGTGGYAAVPQIVVTNALLRIVTGNGSKVYGAANPTFNGAIYAVKTDGSQYANLDGLFLSYECSATTNSPAGSAWSITSSINDPNSKLAYYDTDYANSQLSGTLTVSKASLTINPKDMTIRPGQARPATSAYTTATNLITGFVNNEDLSVITTWPVWDSAYVTTAAVGATFPITNKVAAVAANYDFVYGTGTLTVKANTPPTPVLDAVAVSPTNITKIDVSKLIKNDISPFGDALTLVSVSSVSSNGVPIVVDGTKFWIYYNVYSASLTPGSVDHFTYTVRDSVGGRGTGTVYVRIVKPSINVIPNNIFKAEQDSTTGAYTLYFLGVSGRLYNMQQSVDLVNWSSLNVYDRNIWPDISAMGAYKTNKVICTNGIVKVTDTDTSGNSQRFWRVTTE